MTNDVTLRIALEDELLTEIDAALLDAHVVNEAPTGSRPGACIEQAYDDARVLMGNEGAMLEASRGTVWALANWLRTVVLPTKLVSGDRLERATVTMERVLAEHPEG